MAPKPLTYQTRDLIQEAVRGARLAGQSIKMLKIDRQGKITVQMGGPATDCVGDKGEDNQWDKLLEEEK